MAAQKKQVKIRLVKSLIGRPKDQKETVKSLKLRKINSAAVHAVSPSIMGMINKVSHLVETEEV